MAGQCQRSQAWRQFCRKENSLKHFPKTLLDSYRFSHLYKHTTQMFNTAAKNEQKNKLLYFIYKHKLVLPLMAGRCRWRRGEAIRGYPRSFVLWHVHIFSRSQAVSGQTLQRNSLCPGQFIKGHLNMQSLQVK